jgi:hypothetical protein
MLIFGPRGRAYESTYGGTLANASGHDDTKHVHELSVGVARSRTWPHEKPPRHRLTTQRKIKTCSTSLEANASHDDELLQPNRKHVRHHEKRSLLTMSNLFFMAAGKNYDFGGCGWLQTHACCTCFGRWCLCIWLHILRPSAWAEPSIRYKRMHAAPNTLRL